MRKGLFAAVAVSALCGCVLADDGVRAALMKDVHEIAAPGLPGAVVATGPRATVVIAGDTGDGSRAAVVAAAEGEKGRIVAFGHDGYFGREALGKGDTGRLLLNSVAWAGRKDAPRVGVLDQPGALEYLEKRGVDAAAVKGGGDLSGFDVLVLTHGALRDEALPQFEAFLGRGGGLVIASCAWGWCQITHRPIAEHPGNRLCAAAGVVWTEGTLPNAKRTGFDGAEPGRLVHAGRALDALLETRGPAEGEATQAVASALLAARSVPRDDAVFWPRLAGLRAAAGEVVPTAAQPVKKTDGLRRLALGMNIITAQGLAPEAVRADPAAADFPGAVPGAAPRVHRSIALDTHVGRWHSTGLYAPPGELITVRLPTGIKPGGLGVRIGAHTDELWHLADWRRAPAVSREWPLRDGATTVASAFGGSIYITVPEGSKAPPIEVEISGAVEAPLYVRGTTDIADWRRTIRSAPGPWADLVGERLILTVPSDAIRSVDDPDAVMEFWDRVVRAEDTLAAWPASRCTSPERIVCDRQISAGYMHSGYPIMAPVDGSMSLALDAARLKKEPSWGHFHELGHNHQERAWTFDGTGEVTCNLFSMYVTDRVVGQAFDAGHPAISDRAKRLAMVKSHLASGAPFEKWKSDPFLALSMYIELIDAFGWGPFERIFVEYRDLPGAERPGDDNAARDQWLVRLSRRVGRNLGPFFQRWGVPTSEAARDSIKSLPPWMPEELKD